ncbi:hypothetical protein FACS1894184_16450 [Clostridia bacterium]|nr:hypothetical protein FACS1894184_16450 [Clostridia bacterium]
MEQTELIEILKQNDNVRQVLEKYPRARIQAREVEQYTFTPIPGKPKVTVNSTSDEQLVLVRFTGSLALNREPETLFNLDPFTRQAWLAEY